MNEKKVIVCIVEGPSDEAALGTGTYQKTWDYIEQNSNSLNRHSNMHLMFEKA